jgi:hypothetical protein
MTDPSPSSLRALLPARLARMDEVVRDAAGSSTDLEPGRVAWRFFGEKAADCIRSAVDGDVLELLGNAWSIASELHAYAGPPEHLRGQTVAVTLGRHEFTHTVALDLQLSLNGRPVGSPLRLDLDLTAAIESVVLTIRDGRIVGIGNGEGHVSLQLKYKDIPLHDEVRGAELRPSVLLTLQPGITLP